MQGSVSNLAKMFLQEISKVKQEETLDSLIEVLESVVDPDPAELYLIESLYQLKEKMVLTESRLSSFVSNKRKTLDGDKLFDLYNNKNSFGSSKLFND